MEANQGGDYLTRALRAIDPKVPPRVVRASKGKMIRAQPISILAEQGRLHHIGHFPKLEDQLCVMTADVDRNKHDDRADAMIWAVSELHGITDGSYLEAYGFHYCNSCGHAFRKVYKKCPKCGHDNDGGDAKAALRPGSWASAYMTKCKKCDTQYTVKEGSCPTCNPNPMKYMSQVHKMTNKGGSWLQYQEKNWLNRRI
jgi:rubrerythrin